MVECLLFFGAGAGAVAGEKNTRSHSWSKINRLRNTAQGTLSIHLSVARVSSPLALCWKVV